MQLLLTGVQAGRRVPYGRVASLLEERLGIAKVFPTHIGVVAGALMDKIHTADPKASLLNLLVVNAEDWEPGSGSNGYIKEWFGVTSRELKKKREAYVQEAINHVRSYRRWPEIYRALFNADFEPSDFGRAIDVERDGQPDNPRYARGGPESDEHRRLKEYVRDHPAIIGIKGPVSTARTEARLLSGDMMDVEFLYRSTRLGVEVKSIRSGDADLERGIYQCVKYRAVMIAESGFDEDEADCHSLLVTEEKLPTSLKRLAKRLGVKNIVVPVNR
jgi:hypothetical protein